MKIALQAADRQAASPHAERARLALREVRKLERLLAALAECGGPSHLQLHVSHVSALVAASAGEVEEELALRQVSVKVLGATAAGEVRCDARGVQPLLAQLLLEGSDLHRGGGALEVTVTRREATVELQLPLARVPQGSAAWLCVAGLETLLGPLDGGARWTDTDGGSLVIRLPAAS